MYVTKVNNWFLLSTAKFICPKCKEFICLDTTDTCFEEGICLICPKCDSILELGECFCEDKE